MAALHIALPTVALVATLVVAFLVDAASVDLEPGATVTSLPRTLTTLALLGTIAAALGWLPRGVRSLRGPRALSRRAPRIRVRYA
jgi:hypothetical protein